MLLSSASLRVQGLSVVSAHLLRVLGKMWCHMWWLGQGLPFTITNFSGSVQQIWSSLIIPPPWRSTAKTRSHFITQTCTRRKIHAQMFHFGKQSQWLYYKQLYTDYMDSPLCNELPLTYVTHTLKESNFLQPLALRHGQDAVDLTLNLTSKDAHVFLDKAGYINTCFTSFILLPTGQCPS